MNPPGSECREVLARFERCLLFGDGSTLDKPDIPAQQKLYLAEQRHYVTVLRNIPYPLESLAVIRNWRSEMEEDPICGYDYEAGIVSRNPKLMWFHIARSEGLFATNAERLNVCLSNTYYGEDVDRIPRELTQPIPAGSTPGEEHHSDVIE